MSDETPSPDKGQPDETEQTEATLAQQSERAKSAYNRILTAVCERGSINSYSFLRELAVESADGPVLGTEDLPEVNKAHRLPDTQESWVVADASIEQKSAIFDAARDAAQSPILRVDTHGTWFIAFKFVDIKPDTLVGRMFFNTVAEHLGGMPGEDIHFIIAPQETGTGFRVADADEPELVVAMASLENDPIATD